MTDMGDGSYTASYSVPGATTGDKWSLTADIITGNGLYVEYWNNNTLSGVPVLAQVEDSDMNYNFGGRNVTPTQSDNTSVRWSAYLEPDYSENYNFNFNYDERIAMWLDQDLKIDNNVKNNVENYQIDLQAGRLYSYRQELEEDTGGAKATVKWESASQIK